MQQEQFDKLERKVEWTCKQIEGLLRQETTAKKRVLSDGTPIDKFFVCRRKAVLQRRKRGFGNISQSRRVGIMWGRRANDKADHVDRRHWGIAFTYATSRDPRIRALESRKS